uniref:Signal peptide peptidase n=1 Tax=Megaviridae environmental sample TaxID=1737588 RepID=A0A5J6VK56_9VIRU|nr:MAG: signal peptide peptidase [Megaviridae environmental sample]
MEKILLLLFIHTTLNILTKNNILESNYSVYVNMILTTLGCAYIGTNLNREPTLISETQADTMFDEGLAKMYPLILSVVLFSIYGIIKLFPNNSHIFLTIFFYISVLSSLLNLVPKDQIDTLSPIITILIIMWCSYTILTKKDDDTPKIYINNIIAILISISSINAIKTNNINTSVLLLAGLFIFDIFWVFGSKLISSQIVGEANAEGVMEKVATTIDAPIMLRLFNNTIDNKTKLNILGLGDIVLPAIFIKSLKCLGNNYYNTGLLSHLIGLIFTFISMEYFKSGQPALLYIVPAMFIPFFTRLAYDNGMNINNILDAMKCI